MRYNSYIPIVNNALWRVKFATAGNWEFTPDGSYAIYTREPVLIEVLLKDAGADAETVTLIAPDGEFPDVTWVCPPAVNGKTTLIADVTPYVKAWNGTTPLVIRYDSEDSSISLPAFECRDGVAPHSLMIDSRIIATFEEDGGPGGAFGAGGIRLYGKLPSVVYQYDKVEVLMPLEYDNSFAEYDYEDYADYMAYLLTCLPNLLRTAAVVTFAGVGYKVMTGTSVFQTASVGVFKLNAVAYEWEMEDTEYTSYDDEKKTDIYMRVIEPDCGARMVTVSWKSRCGNMLESMWEIVQHMDDVTDEVQLAALDGEYTGKKGAAYKMQLRKRGLSAFDVWYYGSIVTSDTITVRGVDGSEVRCKALTKSVQADEAGEGEYYMLDVELEYLNYGAY